MKFRGIISVAFALLCCSAGLAQNDFRKEFEEFSKSNSEEFKNFEEKNNAEFAETLKDNWEKFQAAQGKVRQSKPKPRITPKYEKAAEVPYEEIEVAPVEEAPAPKDTEAVAPSVRTGRSKTSRSNLKKVSFDFYGTGRQIDVPEEYGRFHLKGITEYEVAQFWKRLASCRFSPVLECFSQSESELHLNDWAAFEWVEGLSKALFPENVNNEQEVFSVFILNQLGLAAKIARIGNSLAGMFNPMQQIYARSYIVIGNSQWYPFHGDFGDADVFTYRQNFVLPTKPFDMRLDAPMNVGTESDIHYVSRKSATLGCEMKIPINTGLMKFYEGYPQMDVNVYADAEPSAAFSGALLGAVRERIKGKGEQDAVNALLAFLQRDFKYATDNEQFGYEKPFFCEENFIYDCNDCEDRAILLSYLVRRLLGLKVVLLDYPGHVATAVRFNGEMNGDYFVYDGGKYYVCDPTYMGAPAGVCMPDYKRLQARIMELKQL